MTREEALSLGKAVAPTQPSMQRRMRSHDYHRAGFYMLTLVVRDRQPLFGSLQGCLNAVPGVSEPPHVVPSPLGRAILEEEILKVHRYYPMVDVWRLCLMPDHLHIILRVTDDLPAGKHLGHVVAGFKSGCNKAYWRLSQMASPPRPGLFEEGYNDKILIHEGQLDTWKRYLIDNPRRLLVKRQHPGLFTILRELTVEGEVCQAVGNHFLLDIPDKMAVIVHRRYTDVENERLRAEWLACGERGGVLVSAAISPKEKAVLREAFNRGHRIILLRENGFPPLYKPSGESFYACAQGLLLELSPWPYHNDRRVITRQQCLHLNALAERLAGR